jgi:hypothetical protein
MLNTVVSYAILYTNELSSATLNTVFSVEKYLSVYVPEFRRSVAPIYYCDFQALFDSADCCQIIQILNLSII